MRGIEAIRHYAKMRETKPILGIGDGIHAIHTGTEFAAELRVSDLIEALREFDEIRNPMRKTDKRT